VAKTGEKVGETFSGRYRASLEAEYVPVAVKLVQMRAQEDQRLLRLSNEVKILRTLENSLHTVKLLKHFHTNANQFLVYECCEGGPLTSHMAGQPVPIGEVHRILADLSAALDSLYSHGVVHRDLCPENVWQTLGGTYKLWGFDQAMLN